MIENGTSPASVFSAARFRSTQLVIFLVGMAAMIVAGWYLIEGMLHFAGDDTSKRVFIAAGIIFQITESICFIAAAALTAGAIYWRISLVGLGTLLFLFSITVMTLAQKATLQTGESEAQAQEQQTVALQNQIKSLEQMISSYRLNAEKQSKSIFANSRELGQDSLNRATELENQKLELSNKLFVLNSAKRQTSSDFFKQLENTVGLPALQTEFYFLVCRSLLLELCGIFLMAFAAYLKYPAVLKDRSQLSNNDKGSKLAEQPRIENINRELVNSGHWASPYIRSLKQTSPDTNEQ